MIKTLPFNKLSQHSFTVWIFEYLHLISSGLACEWCGKDVRMLVDKIYIAPPSGHKPL